MWTDEHLIANFERIRRPYTPGQSRRWAKYGASAYDCAFANAYGCGTRLLFGVFRVRGRCWTRTNQVAAQENICHENRFASESYVGSACDQSAA
jgi:hypothetical protein